jgi:hypothetical protein
LAVRGGISPQLNQQLDLAAQLLILGLDPLHYLNCDDDFERAVILKIAKRAVHHKMEIDKHLAYRIGEVIARAMGGK